MIAEGEDAEIVFSGMEVVRRDWTELTKRVQRELYSRLFQGNLSLGADVCVSLCHPYS